MKRNHAQSLVYICIGIESKLNKLKGKTVYHKKYDGGYEFGEPPGRYDGYHILGHDMRSTYS
ncbi:hypothetical protein KAM330_48080 (plasmid) [Aeromonas hydrophila]|nr:hypothetical protein KAM330_48080 [Aeromonas hydrophila]